MNIKNIANSVGSIVIEGLKEIRGKRVPLTATTLANYLKENEEFYKIFEGIQSTEVIQELRYFLIEKASFFASVLNVQDFIQIKDSLEKDPEGEHLKNDIITIISLVAEYLDKAINVQSRLKSIIDEIVIRFDKTSNTLNSILEENSNILKKDIEEDKKIANELTGVNHLIINESSIEALKSMVLSKVDELSKEISKKIDNKHTALKHLEQEKKHVNKELSEYKVKEQELAKIKKELEKYKMESVTDPLTGLFNRKFMIKKIEEEIERGKRYGSKFSIIFLDIDNFKRMNDVYGHIVGDFVLKYLANIIKSELRKVDYAFRYGGEEMVILLSETNLENALKFSERLLEVVRNTIFKYKTEDLKITVSIGVAEFKPGETIEQLIERADMAMLKAKQAGKDRVVSG
ncbi:diguanylate cyclase [Calditerrivibrio nitroreducens]|uniref:GGDEF domain-containing protein n=1 Tax=Calditerrivibrio nitroreducens TaxID=477976 RepID=UPI003C783DD4